jgi:hypothetical protein
MQRAARAVVGLVWLVLVGSAAAQGGDRYARCQAEALDISGYRGDSGSGVLAGALKGGLGGAALGAAGGWVLDRDAGKTAKRGAALGALIGAARAASAKRDDSREREVYERALERCMARDD